MQRFPGLPGSVRGGVFAVLGRFVGCWGRAYWAVERLPAGADRSFGADSQKVSCTVAAGSVKRFSPASKSMGLSSKSTEPELTDISKVATGLGCPGDELRPGTWTRLMVAVMRLPVGPDLGILLGSGP